jgi:hypothetical protein
VQTDSHEWLVLLTVAPMAPGLEPAFNPVLGRIQILAESGLSSMMVLHDFLSKRITPLQDCSRPTWLYIGVNDATRLERGDGSNLDDMT